MKTCEMCGAEIPDAFERCRERFELLLTKHYSEPEWAKEHLTAVDAYVLQHSAEEGPRSNAFHLMRLGLILTGEHEAHIGARPPRSLGKTFEKLYKQFPHLEAPDPPEGVTPLTIDHVIRISDPKTYLTRVREWGQSVWDTWEKHHNVAQKSAQFLKDRVVKEKGQ